MDIKTAITRRKFLGSATVATLGALAAPNLVRASAQVMQFASPYANDAKFAPTAQTALKANIENLTGGEIQVELLDSGKGGIGGELLAQVIRNGTQGGIISFSNLSRYSSAVDVLNIPFWAANNQKFLNLVTSSVWNEHVISKVNEKGIEVLYPCVVGARTLTSVKKFTKTVATPEDAIGARARIPSSKILGQYYQLIGAKPTSLEWGLTARAARGGRFDLLDSSPLGLFSGPDNLKDEIGTISTVESVHDGWVSIVSKNWIESLSQSLKDKVMEAAEMTQQAQLDESRSANEAVRDAFIGIGAEFYNPSAEEREMWAKAAGYERDEWANWKSELVGSNASFEKLLAAAETNGRFTF